MCISLDIVLSYRSVCVVFCYNIAVRIKDSYICIAVASVVNAEIYSVLCTCCKICELLLCADFAVKYEHWVAVLALLNCSCTRNCRSLCSACCDKLNCCYVSNCDDTILVNISSLLVDCCASILIDKELNK